MVRTRTTSYAWSILSCARVACRFAGTWFSTFTGYIHRLRGLPASDEAFDRQGPWAPKARRATLGDDGEMVGLGKRLCLDLAHVGEGADDAYVGGVDEIVRLHRPQRAVVQRGHQEGLGEVVEVL